MARNCTVSKKPAFNATTLPAAIALSLSECQITFRVHDLSAQDLIDVWFLVFGATPARAWHTARIGFSFLGCFSRWARYIAHFGLGLYTGLYTILLDILIETMIFLFVSGQDPSP
ncbi:hypothetical protein BDW62DRAFT_49822 [Aspergillus aurantiobrunneus]